MSQSKTGINAFLERRQGVPLRTRSVRWITFSDGETRVAIVRLEPDEPNHPTRYEVKVEAGVETGESDAHGSNPTFSWVFPCNSVDEAVERFVDRIEETRNECGYYDLSGQDLQGRYKSTLAISEALKHLLRQVTRDAHYNSIDRKLRENIDKTIHDLEVITL